MILKLPVVMTVLAVVGMLHSPAVAEDTLFQHEHVLGTSLELRISTEEPGTAVEVEQATLAEIARLSSILSRYDAHSELMQWQSGARAGKPLSRELFTVLNRAEEWRKQTHSAFDVRAGALLELWKAAELQQVLPRDEQRREMIAALSRDPWKVTGTQRIQRHDQLPISLDALAKGYILDAVCELVAKQHPEVTSFSINIGGDLRKLGTQPLRVGITNPAHPAEGESPLHRFTMSRPFALATSGGYRRGFEIQGREYSHILDPRTGFPAGELLTASVLAPTAMDADAAATALCVMGAEEGLRLIESLEGFECLMQTADGRVIVSEGWPNRPLPAASMLVKFDEKKEKEPGLYVDFSLNRPQGGVYRRPYAAVWIEDADGFPVKTAILWMQTQQPGPRWHRDLARWYRHDRMRQLAEKTNLIDTISGATRGPGDYQAKFDGTDNNGKPLPPGKYTLYIEVTRERGTYQYVREEIELGEKPIAPAKLKDNVEFSNVTYEYIPWTK